MTKPIITVDLTGPQGNIYCLMALTAEAMEQANMPKVDLLSEIKTHSRSYEEAIAILQRYVTFKMQSKS
jgi:hypothetical protein